MLIDEAEHDAAYDRHAKVYEPNKLPSEVSRTLYISFGIGRYNAGRIVIDDTPPRNGEDFAAILLTKKEVVFELPPVKVDIKGKLLEVLQEEKRKIVADNHMRLKAIEDKIANVLAIEFQPTDAA